MVYKVVEYANTTTMKVQPISYSSKSLISAQTNIIDSTVKTKLDSWYKENLVSYSSYLADETFCNDRSVVSGNGYKVDSYTIYGAYTRLQAKKTPSLKCVQENDKFKVSSTSAKLDYPVGLITADEVSFAGAKSWSTENTANTNFYLYTGALYFTMTPAAFDSAKTSGMVMLVRNNGILDTGDRENYSFGIRPVISLKSDVTISKGDGSSINPFVLSEN